MFCIICNIKLFLIHSLTLWSLAGSGAGTDTRDRNTDLGSCQESGKCHARFAVSHLYRWLAAPRGQEKAAAVPHCCWNPR